MLKDTKTLDLSNEMDVLYLYKNIKIVPELLRDVQKIKFSDFSFSLFCYSIIENAVFEELNEFFTDFEMEEMLHLSAEEYVMRHLEEALSENICGEEAKYANNNEGTHLEDNSSEDKASENKIVAALPNIFYLKHLDIMLKPLVNICNKQIVDLVYYVFKKSGYNHFEFLFNVFNENTQLIELHLLVAKAMKDRPFDLTDIKECLNESTDSGVISESETKSYNLNSELSSLSISSENKCIKSSEEIQDCIKSNENNKKALKIEVGGFSEDNSSEDVLENIINLTACPFMDKKNHSYHLQRAKELMMSYSASNNYCSAEPGQTDFGKNENIVFFVDNLCTFLSIKFDKEIFTELLRFSFHDSFSSNLKKIPNLPFIFYENAKIEKIMAPASKTPKKDPYELSPTQCSCPIPINAYTLKYFLEFCHSTFFNINSAISDYILISKSLRHFVEFYRHPAFFKIFYELLNCKVSKIESELRENLLCDLPLYISVFYLPEKESNRRVDYSKKSNLSVPGNDKRAVTDSDIQVPDKEGVSESKDFLSKWSLNFSPQLVKGFDKSNSREKGSVHPFPSINDESKDLLIEAYMSPSYYTEIEQRISDHLLNLFSESYNEDQVDTCHFLENFLIENSLNADFKVYVLKSISSIHDSIFKSFGNGVALSAEEKCLNKEEVCESDPIGSVESVDIHGSVDNKEKTEIENDEESKDVKHTQFEEKHLSFFQKILKNLKIFPELNWRYKKVFIRSIDSLEKVGVEREWVKEELKNDTVFYIKNMVRKL